MVPFALGEGYLEDVEFFIPLEPLGQTFCFDALVGVCIENYLARHGSLLA